jgi:hypothetical protein
MRKHWELLPIKIQGWLYSSWSSAPINDLFIFVFFVFGAEAMGEYRASRVLTTVGASEEPIATDSAVLYLFRCNQNEEPWIPEV